MPRLPVMSGVIDRRVLVNYRVDPRAIARQLPAPFEPKLVDGWAIAGVCLIRLTGVRPRGLPRWLGVRSENAAHRIAVQWDDAGERCEGVFIPRRDTDSRLNALVGGRLFPGEHHHARFTAHETEKELEASFVSDDRAAGVEVAGRVCDDLPATSVFGSLKAASAFFEAGSLGYSATREPGRFDGLELRCGSWSVTPLEITHARSSFYDDAQVFPRDSVQLDCALLMRGIEHAWHGRPSLCCD